MSIEVGNKLKGRATGIKKFGAFVKLPEGKNDLVHVGEVADNYVENVEEHLSVDNKVDVRVLSIADGGKVSLSIKETKDRPCRQRTSKPGHQKPMQKAEDFEKRLSNFLRDSEDKLTSIKRQTESGRGDEGPRHQLK